ncbi:UDP-2,3-diacylglucosamine diphosphatase [Vibrio mangrovi]|uniref:UDP-2,3-diacylglucosamine hydrolase n=1 Tax=Vibrio mangrovi TaxID=474394 RepID=A0A1Y6IPA6_9VIBR|nr:UDP-2,3-diacylglucosamine diphosphatase [Vibrio mangrovi]MDW6003713.1 UDP-2,3-diacylglucosamine diphosphatase [Vibrio mangrovi]SMR99495.1 UDP-2,3-diacylglucosamine hydrolase [Vibrio mangrovi]
MHTLFISDLHLTPTRPEITAAFQHLMQHRAPQADALYILGDLFDFWIGDDDPGSFAQTIKDEFRKLTSSGTPCYFVHGNRDFLIGKRFSRETGVQLLGEKTLIELYGKRLVIMHGDTLCLDDVRYLQFRKKVHQPWLQWIYYRLPFTLKQRIVSKVKQDVRMDKQSKSLAIMDVTQAEVERVMAEYQVDMMIHGHTHRPNIHHFDVDGTEKTRIVLGDWDHELSVLEYHQDSRYCLLHQQI